MTKCCTKCGETKPTSDFYKRSLSPDGLTSRCRECLKADLKRSHRKYRDKRLEEMRLWREANRDKVQENNQRWYAANRERADELKRRWVEDNRDRQRAYRRQRYAEKSKADPLYPRLHEGVNRARRAGAPAERFDSAELSAYWQSNGVDPGVCFYCSGPFEELDHMHPLKRDGSPGHVVGNLVPACLLCNNRKGNRTAEEFMRAV